MSLNFLPSLGGPRGFSDVLWKVEKYVREGDQPLIKFSYHSFDGEEGID